MIEKISNFIKKVIHFLTYDIWRFTRDELSAKRMTLYDILKSFILVFRNIDRTELNTRAAALTYKNLLSIVPILAVLFAIARGFGLQDEVQRELIKYFEGQTDLINRAMTFIDNSLQYAHGGVFLGIGVVILLYTVVNLLSSIEDNFNLIWNIKNGRTYYRQFTDYLALIVIAPVFLICNAGFSILLSNTANMELIGYMVRPIIKIAPFLITIFLFTFLYIYIPNTKVRFMPAFIAGTFSGTVFQIFQMLYIGGQIWISKYNAIYGSFAALPLLMLWLQLSWFILLFGVQLSYAYQNVAKFSFEQETKNISRRFKDFVLLAILNLIVKRFENGEKPYTADEISMIHRIPTKLTSESIYYLLELGVIVETPTIDLLVPAYVPAIDINKLTVGYLLNRINSHGSEDFKIDIDVEFNREWQRILDIEEQLICEENDILIKDL